MQPILPMTPGQAERGTHDNERNGVTSRRDFVVRRPQRGDETQVIGECDRRHRQQEFVKVLDTIATTIPEQEGVPIHLTLENSATQKTPNVKCWLARHLRFVVHFTSTSGSWLN